MSIHKKKNTTVSVIVPCYNSATFVTRAVECVLQQQYEYWELLLVDNGSTDNTLEILNQQAARHPEKITVLTQPVPGAPAARNLGIAHAKGSYLQFLDSDDELLTGKLLEQVAIAQTYHADVVAGNFYKISPQEKGWVATKHKCLQRDVWMSLVTTGMGRTSSMLFRKDAVLKAGSWNEAQTSSQEYELLFRMFKNNCKVRFSNGFNTRIYLQNESIHLSKDPQKALNVARNYVFLRKQIKNYLMQKGLFTSSFRREFNQHVLGYLMNVRHQMPEFYQNSLAELELHPTTSFYLKRWSRIVRQRIIT